MESVQMATQSVVDEHSGFLTAVPRLFSRTLTALIAFVLACVLSLVLAPAAFADESTITVNDPEHGELEFTVITQASAETLGTVRLTNGKTWQGDLVLGRIVSDDTGYFYGVTAVGASAFANNTLLTSVEFQSNLTGSVPAIGANAFERCTNLKKVVFPQKVAGIGANAFLRCTSLETVNFAPGAQLYGTTGSTGHVYAIGNNAFEHCTSLKAITIPAITSTQRSPDYYDKYDAPTSSAMLWSSYRGSYGSGSSNAPTYRQAFGGGVFMDCTALESVVFEPSGTQWGLFAYFAGNYATNPVYNQLVFQGCSKLKSVIFGAEQPFFADPDRSTAPGNNTSPPYRNVFTDSGVTPSLYYAVNYYATDDEAFASSDIAFANGRYTRIAYQRNTPIAAITTSDIGALTNRIYPDASAYGSDGIIPDPQTVAVAANLDSDTQWVWKLGNTQSRRAGLSDSCYAYLAPADDISVGRVGAAQISTMYKLSGQNLSRGHDSLKDSPFDVVRFYDSDPRRSDYGFYVFSEGQNNFKLALNEGETAWFTLDSSVEQSFFSQINIYAPEGTLLNPESYEVTFERYDVTSKVLISATLGDEQDGGPLLMTVKPNEQSGYTGILQEWVLVNGQSGSVRENYTNSPTGTLAAATHYNGNSATVNTSPYTGPYAVAIGSKDLSSALVASSYAGLVSAPISVRDTTDAAYGFDLATSFYTGNGVIVGDLVSFPAKDFSKPSDFAVAVFEAFEDSQRSLLGASTASYPWGDTAILIAPGSLEDVAAATAAYAYAKKAPVFFTEADGTVSDETLACLKNFDKVVVMGDTTQFSQTAFEALNTNVANLARISGDSGSASSLSLAVADSLISEDAANCSIVTVTDAVDIADAIVALSLSGHEGGIALVSACTADSKLINAYLHDKRDAVRTVRLFGRNNTHMSSASFDFYGYLGGLWSNSNAAAPVGQGDTLVLYGLQLEIGADHELAFNDVRLWGSAGLTAGSYTYGGEQYQLKEAIEATTEPPVDPDPKDPDPKDPDPKDPDPKDPDPKDPDDSKDPDTTTKPPASTDNTNSGNNSGGNITVNTPSVGTSQTGTSGGGSATFTVSPFTVEDAANTDESAPDEDSAIVDDKTPLSGESNSQQSSSGSQQTATDPNIALLVVGSSILALGAALWFAMRRRKSPALMLAEEM